MASPVVPPRPQRAQPGPTAVPQIIPQVPTRPNRHTDLSPARDMARSPLNEPPTAMSNGQSSLPASGLLKRPPSVASLPSLGQEGNEYASYDQLPPEAHGISDASPQTRHANVPMLAPTASIPSSTAKSRISAVTRTDSSSAAAVGIGKEEEQDGTLKRVTSREPHPLRTTASFNRSSQSLLSSGTPRPPSIHSQNEFEHGIPVIGQTVPMYPNAGDVQAPSPAPGQTTFPAGIGFFNDGSARAHQRRRSSRQEFGPPGSYGLHGHPGQQPSDQFEREWIAKHPDMAAREGYNVYGGLEPRPASALTSAQLNRLVGESDDIGFGTNRDMVGTPDQEIGYLASDIYAAHMSSAKASPVTGEPRKRPSSGAQQPVDLSTRQAAAKAHSEYESEDEIFHVDPPEFKHSKITGGGPQDGGIDLGPRGGNTAELGGWFDERGSGIPILASDERMKRPGSAYLQPAVNPEHRDDDDLPPSRRGSLQASRPSSRPGSTHGHHGFGGPLSRFVSHDEHHGSGVGTPLEEIEEYEPLFPEEDGKLGKIIKEKIKQRPNLAAHHFPSQDVWEDTPESLQFTTDVDTPEPERARAAAVFETPAQEQQRRAQNPHDMTSDAKTFAKPHFKALALDRPGVQRFPSQDIWEDTPDSSRLETTVDSPQEDVGVFEERPTTSALPLHQDEGDARATTGLPQIPSRPQTRSKLNQELSPEDDERAQEVPDLGASPTKPTVPPRPARLSHGEQTDAPPAPRSKPAVPARPTGNKLAGLRANFMNDLNSRLQLGPQAPPSRPVEPEAEAPEEKTPLADARKSRAKGPARRKPAHSAPESFGLSFSSMTLWHIDEEDELKIGADEAVKAAANKELAVNEAANLEKSPPIQAESGYTEAAIGHHGDIPDPTVSPAVVSEVRAVQPELEQALASAEPAPASAEERQAKDAAASIAHESGSLASKAGPFDVKAPEQGNVAVRDGEEVGRTD